jgi:hypothetical protein
MLASHEGDVVPRRRQRQRHQHDERDARDDGEDAARRRGDDVVDDVEADLVGIGDDERSTPQHQPDPAQHRHLLGPAERLVEDVAERDLQQERSEHRRDQHDRDVVGYDLLTISSKAWSTLKPDQQARFRSAAEKAIDDYTASFEGKEKDAVAALKAEGKKVYTPDVAAFRSYAQKRYIDKYGKDWPPGAIEKINAL